MKASPASSSSFSFFVGLKGAPVVCENERVREIESVWSLICIWLPKNEIPLTHHHRGSHNEARDHSNPFVVGSEGGGWMMAGRGWGRACLIVCMYGQGHTFKLHWTWHLILIFFLTQTFIFFGGGKASPSSSFSTCSLSVGIQVEKTEQMKPTRLHHHPHHHGNVHHHDTANAWLRWISKWSSS